MLVATPAVKLSIVLKPGGSEPSRRSLSKYCPRAAQPAFHAWAGELITLPVALAAAASDSAVAASVPARPPAAAGGPPPDRERPGRGPIAKTDRLSRIDAGVDIHVIEEALAILARDAGLEQRRQMRVQRVRSEEHTSELQSHSF